MTNISQKQPINILKPLIMVCRQGFTELCSDWSKYYFRIFHVFFKLTKVSFAFCHSVAFVDLGKQCCMRKYHISLRLFIFKAELGFVMVVIVAFSNTKSYIDIGEIL